MRTQHRKFQPGAWLGRVAAGGAVVALLVGSTVVPVAAQPLPTDARTVQVVGTGAATAPAETGRIQLSLVKYADVAMNTVSSDVTVLDGAEGTDSSPEPVVSEPVVSEPVVSEPAVVPGITSVQIHADELTPIVDAMVEAGAPADAVRVNIGPGLGGGYYGPGAPGYALIEVLFPDPTVEAVKAIITAGTDTANGGPIVVEQVGVEYNIADCAPLIEAAQAAAFADARSRAESLARHFGASVGAPVLVSDFGMTQMPLNGDGGCPPTPDYGYGIYGPMPAFNTPPFSEATPAEARALVQVSVAYEFELASQ